jgi:hypothetical protein
VIRKTEPEITEEEKGDTIKDPLLVEGEIFHISPQSKGGMG